MCNCDYIIKTIIKTIAEIFDFNRLNDNHSTVISLSVISKIFNIFLATKKNWSDISQYY